MTIETKFTGSVYLTTGLIDTTTQIEMASGNPATIVLEVSGPPGAQAAIQFCLDRDDPVWNDAPVGASGIVEAGARAGFEAMTPIDLLQIAPFGEAVVKVQIRQK